jgi:hypothetical protein
MMPATQLDRGLGKGKDLIVRVAGEAPESRKVSSQIVVGLSFADA